MAGAFIVFRPSFESNPFPLVVAFLSAVTSGVAYTFLSFFKGKVDGLTVMMHFSTFSAIASIPFMLKDFVVPSFKQAVLLLLIGVFGYRWDRPLSPMPIALLRPRRSASTTIPASSSA